ncbi:undecaprenyl/decaprenyl-phosphate alpha-N-acetylglucosaminyl 1-phosphate transferase [Candidatus Uhrbacteria bacterium]|nr:undecaprenyl/decaprenyl-phosphate alpha-N-acetylglucosaminyl 1-phosphate transferase [Candidatus Uhrbacteria bacterium]
MRFWIAMATVVLSVLIAGWIRQWAAWHRYVDRPQGGRKIHTAPIPFGGGIAIVIAWGVGILLWVVFEGWPGRPTVSAMQLTGIVVSCIVLLVGGYMDDRRSMSAWKQVLISVAAIVILLIVDIRLTTLRLPWDGIISFQWARINLGNIAFVWPADILTIAWVLVISYSTKLFDGIDGLVTGMGAIGGFILFAVSLLPTLNQPQNAMIALLFAASCLGILFWNWHPAKIFLGQGGSVLIGHVMAALSIVTGTKVMTTLLVVGIALFDLAWVVFRRAFFEHRSPFSGDQRHIHHRLLDQGLSQRQTAVLLLGISALFGILAILLQTAQKIIALVALLAVCLLLAVTVVLAKQRTSHHRTD